MNSTTKEVLGQSLPKLLAQEDVNCLTEAMTRVHQARLLCVRATTAYLDNPNGDNLFELRALLVCEKREVAAFSALSIEIRERAEAEARAEQAKTALGNTSATPTLLTERRKHPRA
jgi:hypothetical protein